MNEHSNELPEARISLDDVMGKLASDQAPVKEEAVPQYPSGHLNYHDVCVLWGDSTWSRLDRSMARAIARELVRKHNLQLQEFSDGRFIINHHAAYAHLTPKNLPN